MGRAGFCDILKENTTFTVPGQDYSTLDTLRHLENANNTHWFVAFLSASDVSLPHSCLGIATQSLESGVAVPHVTFLGSVVLELLT